MLVSSLFLSKNKSARCVLDMGAGMNIKTLKFPKSFEVHYALFINYDKQVNFTLQSRVVPLLRTTCFVFMYRMVLDKWSGIRQNVACQNALCQHQFARWINITTSSSLLVL